LYTCAQSAYVTLCDIPTDFCNLQSMAITSHYIATWNISGKSKAMKLLLLVF